MQQFNTQAGPLSYLERGTGPGILFIHGTGADARIWGRVLDLVAAEHRVVAYDRRGFSRSASRPVRDWNIHVQDAAELVEGLGLTPVTVVGWSSGGPLALDLARVRPDLVKSLLLLEPAMPLISTLTADGVGLLLMGKGRQLLLGDKPAARWFYRWATSYADGGNSFDRLEPALQAAELANATASMVEIQTARAGAGHLGARTLRDIRAPTLCVRGDAGARRWYRRNTEYVSQHLPNSQLRIIAGACHTAFSDSPDAFAALVAEAASISS